LVRAGDVGERSWSCFDSFEKGGPAAALLKEREKVEITWTYPSPPVLGGAPVSPAAMVRADVVKVRRMAVERAALVKDVRSILVKGDSDCLGGRRRRCTGEFLFWLLYTW